MDRGNWGDWYVFGALSGFVFGWICRAILSARRRRRLYSVPRYFKQEWGCRRGHHHTSPVDAIHCDATGGSAA